MDLGVAYRELAKLDLTELGQELAALSDEDWDARPIRRASLAGDDAHCAADTIVQRHVRVPSYSKRGVRTLHDTLLDLARRSGRDGRSLLPVMEERYSETRVYTCPEWFRWQHRVLPVIGPVL